MEQKKINIPGVRCDGYVDNGVDCSNTKMENWILKEIVKKTGEGEDDFMIDTKPILLETIDVQEMITANAKGCSIAEMVASVLRTGDDSIFHQREPHYADITEYPVDALDAHNKILQGQAILDSLDPTLKSKGLDGILSMTKEDIESYVKDLVDKQMNNVKTESIEKDVVKPLETEKEIK